MIIENAGLQPLRITAWWNVVRHQFSETEPTGQGGPVRHRKLLQLKHHWNDVLIDLGRDPEGEPPGTYRLVVIMDNNWEKPLYRYISPDCSEMVQLMEVLMREIPRWRCCGDSTLKSKLSKLSWRNAEVPLHPLRVPAGWLITYNKFSEKDPEELSLMNGPDACHYFCQDLLQVVYEKSNLLLDLGWYSEGEPDGAWGLTLIRGTDWHSPLFEFSTRNRTELVQKMERLMMDIAHGAYGWRGKGK